MNNETEDKTPYLAMAFFCDRIEVDELGLKTYVSAIDSLGFKLEEGQLLSSVSWEGMIAVEITFGEYEGPIEILMRQVEIATGEEKVGLDHQIHTADYPGTLAFSLSVDFKIAYEREGDYRYDFYLNGLKRAMTVIRVQAIRG